MFKFFAFIILSLIFSKSLLVGNIPNTINAFKTNAVINLDGDLNEKDWGSAQYIDNFIQRDPNNGAKATERTEVRILYTETAIYIGAKLFDSEPDKILAKEMSRDFENSRDDGFKVMLDTYNDKTSGYLFIVNPNGAIRDVQIVENGQRQNTSWNSVWEVKTNIDSSGWTAEICIPFSSLKFSDAKSQVWGINFERDIRRKRELVLWQGYSRNYSIETVSQAGVLSGIEDINSTQNIEFKPYAVAGLQRTLKINENVESLEKKTTKDFGFDVNYLPTPTVKLNFTYNTDFAQVESDDQQINLSRFPLYIAEKREFFLEGADFFSVGMGNRIYPFYSRRIGIGRSGELAPIIIGARALGKLDNTTFGLMSIQTDNVGEEKESNYSILNVRQLVHGQSYIGILSANKSNSDNMHSTTGLYGKYSSDNFFNTGKNFLWEASYFRNFNSNSTLKSDAHAYRSYIGFHNDDISMGSSWQRCPKDFEPEAGFLARSNFQEYYAYASYKYRFSDSNQYLTSISFSPGDVSYIIYDDTKKMQSVYYEVTLAKFDFKTNDALAIGLNRNAEGVANPFDLKRTETDTLRIAAQDYWNNSIWLSFDSYYARDFNISLWTSKGGIYSGEGSEYSISAGYRFSKHFKLSLGYQRNDYEIENYSLITDKVSARLNIAVNPKLFGSIYAQWNNQQDNLIINYRLNFIPILGGDFFFVVNQIFDTKSALKIVNTTLLAKLVWRFAE